MEQNIVYRLDGIAVVDNCPSAEMAEKIRSLLAQQSISCDVVDLQGTWFICVMSKSDARKARTIITGKYPELFRQDQD